MTVTKKQWMMLLLGAGVLFLVYWFFFRKKKSESSYDENVMIFGNENGYTNEEIDGGSLEASYGPAFGAYGAYGNETGYKGPVLVGTNNPCPCGDGKQKGICFKSDKTGNAECKTHKLGSSEFAVSGVRGAESSFQKTSPTAALRKKCSQTGGQMGECWNDTTKTWYKCCTFNF